MFKPMTATFPEVTIQHLIPKAFSLAGHHTNHQYKSKTFNPKPPWTKQATGFTIHQ